MAQLHQFISTYVLLDAEPKFPGQNTHLQNTYLQNA